MSTVWPTVRLAEVLQRVERYESRDELTEYPFAGTYSFARGIFVGQRKLGSSFALPKIQRIQAGDFVYCKIMAWEGAFGLVPPEADGCYLSGAFVAYAVNRDRLDARFLDYFFKVPMHWQDIGRQSFGTNVRRQSLHPDQFEKAEIPLPPLAEQRRVVARIEELTGQVGQARRTRVDSAGQVAAITLAYLNRLLGNPYQSVAGTLNVESWVKLDDVVEDVADGPHVTPSYVEQGVPFITALNITAGRIRFDNHKAITPEAHKQYQKRAKAQRGDVLITKDGTIGMPCFVDTDREFSFFVSVALIKPKRPVLDGEYLVWTLRSPYMQQRMAAKSRGDMIRHLVLREIRDLTIPLVSLAEQRRIVTELDALQVKADAIKGLQVETDAELDALLPAILDRAFKGELV